MANITSIGGNPIVPAAVQPNSVTDAMLVQTGGVLQRVNLLHPFAVGVPWDGIINIDTANRIVSIPAGQFVKAGTNGVSESIPAAQLSYSSISWYAAVVVNFSTSAYEIYNYTDYRNLAATSAAILLYFRVPDPRCHAAVCNVTINGHYQAAATAEKGVDAFKTQLDSNYSFWNVASGGTHSSESDLVSASVAAGEKFYVNLTASDGQQVSGTLVARDASGENVYTIGAITSGTLMEFTAVSSFEKIGAYHGAVSDACTMYLNVIKDNSLFAVNAGGQYGVPKYWKSNLDSAIDKVAALQTYDSGVTFGFITDIHWETNHQVSPKLVDYIAHNSRVDMWLNGGDSASGDGSDGTQQMEWLYECIGKYGNGYKFYSINGNHDTNGIGGGVGLNSAEIKNLIMPYYSDVTFGSGNYYWFDYRGTRFVCLDTGVVGASDSAQIAWAENVIRQSTIPVIVVMHIVKVAYSDTIPCAFFNDLIAAIGNNTDGKVKMIVCGHTHHDFTMTASNGIPVVALTTDSRFADDGITRVKGTTTEQCLSVVTIDYGAKTINVTRVGTVGTDMTISY